ncbi:MAG: murein L,D-transpeptidase family protein [Roseitalea porphyridii]|jgi:murein L,D-transpeptidase YafK|uniref:murein L,D-transpeptidase family protein n=1 Tax=Roseitalea porphyridii TaxID=1852022 RepID=UPI0032EB3205
MRLRTALTALALSAAVVLSACQGSDVLNMAAEAPLPRDVVNIMQAKGMTKSSPIMMRIFKEEEVLEVWKQTDTGVYDLVKTYEICAFSGDKGPKFAEGDRQSPEGFYFVNRRLLNPNSSYHLAFNLGFPNAFDRAHGRTGSFLMVHGDCSSRGCYAMTDQGVTEIYAFARDALRGGQQNEFQVQAFPFRMTPENMAKHRDSPHFEYWQMLKSGYDHFELTRTPPKVDVCDRRYVFNQIPEDGDFNPQAQCPDMSMPEPLALAYTTLKQQHALQFERAVADLEGRSINLQEGMIDMLTPRGSVEPLTHEEIMRRARAAYRASAPATTVPAPIATAPETAVAAAPTTAPAASPASPAAAGSTPLTAIVPGTGGAIVATSSASGLTARSVTTTGAGTPLPDQRPVQ